MQVRLNDVKVIKDFKDFNPKPRRPDAGVGRPSDDESEKQITNFNF